jgi:hypothetical protein
MVISRAPADASGYTEAKESFALLGGEGLVIWVDDDKVQANVAPPVRASSIGEL